MLNESLALGIKYACERFEVKIADIKTKLQPHQERVVSRLLQSDQPGLVAIHGLGSGKTLSSIASSDALGLDTAAIVPASLKENFKKEEVKHKGNSNSTITSLQNIARNREVPKSDFMIVDEAHRARDPNSSTYKALQTTEAKKRLLLTGSPFYNRPSDISPLINLVAQKNVLPSDPDQFNAEYVLDKPVKPGFFGSLKGVKPGDVPVVNPKKVNDLKNIFSKWTDYHPGTKENFPDVREEDVRVPMTPDQLRVYDTLFKKSPAWVAWKVKHNLPPSKQEAANLNAFLTGARQVSNTTAPFITEGSPQQPKIDAAFTNLKKMLEENPNSKAVVYSNFIDAGINPYKKLLDENQMPYGEFTGQMPAEARNDLVRKYNEGKLRTLLLSSAGAEGLDLKGTRLIQLLDPHWNNEKLKQVKGRGARYMSHADLPEEERNLLVQRYLATRPKSGPLERLNITDPGSSIDEYMAQRANEKEQLIDQFKALLEKRSSHARLRAITRTDLDPKFIRKLESFANREKLPLIKLYYPITQGSKGYITLSPFNGKHVVTTVLSPGMSPKGVPISSVTETKLPEPIFRTRKSLNEHTKH